MRLASHPMPYLNESLVECALRLAEVKGYADDRGLVRIYGCALSQATEAGAANSRTVQRKAASQAGRRRSLRPRRTPKQAFQEVL